MGLCEQLVGQKHLRSPKGSIFYLAPEQLIQRFDHKADIWACGVILYILITGRPPFTAHKPNLHGHSVLDRQRIHQMILQGTVTYNKHDFTSVHPQAVHLLQMMLRVDPTRRPEADWLLAQPWLQSPTVSQPDPKGRLRIRTLTVSAGEDLQEPRNIQQI